MSCKHQNRFGSFEILCSFRFIGSVPARYIKKFIDMSEKNSNSYTIYPFIHTCTSATADTSPQQYLVREALLSHYTGLQHNHDHSFLMGGLKGILRSRDLRSIRKGCTRNHEYKLFYCQMFAITSRCQAYSI